VIKRTCTLLLLSALAASAASVPPEPRLARSLPCERIAAHAARVRHNEALKQLFLETGIPLGGDLANVVVRTRALELINYAITNGVELADGGGVTADAVAFAAQDFVGRYVLDNSNAPSNVLRFGVRPDDSERAMGVYTSSARATRSYKWAVLRNGFIQDHPDCAACGRPAAVAHHVVPVHLAPDRELDASNLLPFCDRCHFLVGHLGDWKAYNPTAREDAAEWIARVESRPYAIFIPKTPELLILGDSHAACRLPHSPVDAWTVAELLGVPASNRLAVSGSTARQWASDYQGRLSAAITNRAGIVWISIGGNDALAAAADGQVTAAEQLAVAADMLRFFAAAARGRALCVCTLYADPWQGARPDQAAGLDALDAGISNVCELACSSVGTPVAFLDERTVLTPANYGGSGDLHPNAEGYTNIALRLRSIITANTERINP